MKIALCTDCYQPTKNGVVTSVVQLKAGLEKRGHKVFVITVEMPGFGDNVDSIHRRPSVPFNSESELRAGLVTPAAVRQIIQQEGIELVHTHTEFSVGWAGKKAAIDLSLPLVHTAHTFYEEYRHYVFFGRWISNKAVKRLYRRFLSDYSALICPSAKIAKYIEAFNLNVSTTIIANGIDRDRFITSQPTPDSKHRTRMALGIQDSDQIILNVGRLVPEKRECQLVKSLAPLLQKKPTVRLVLVGDGSSRQQVVQIAGTHSVQDQVILTGFVGWEQIHTLYSIADVFATASLSDVNPLSVIEAITCGLPVVARLDDGFVGLVEDGHNGYLRDSDDQIMNCVADLLANESKRQAFSRNSLILSNKYSAESHVDRVESLYQKIMCGL